MNVLAVAVHPDDETLGCGATLLKHAAAGDKIHWLIVTAATAPDYSSEQIATQAAQIEKVRDAFGFASFHWLKLPTTQLERVPLNQLVAQIRGVVAEVKPEIIFGPNPWDVHSDHRVVFDALNGVVKSFYMTNWGVRRLFACEVLSETDAGPAIAGRAFVPNVFVDVTETLQRKLEIMGLFSDQIQPGWQPRTLDALEALARVRGASIGVRYAEAFMLMREIA